MHFVVSPAYGRDYSNGKAATADWNAGKDFQHESALFTGGGAYINRADVPKGSTVEIRYARKAKLVVVKVK